jgi:hypothetical protein
MVHKNPRTPPSEKHYLYFFFLFSFFGFFSPLLEEQNCNTEKCKHLGHVVLTTIHKQMTWTAAFQCHSGADQIPLNETATLPVEHQHYLLYGDTHSPVMLMGRLYHPCTKLLAK